MYNRTQFDFHSSARGKLVGIGGFAEGRFDKEGRSREWHTAFYYLAEHVRFLTDDAINHKGLYALVGVDGRYMNHDNPLVRKRTAGALSRIVHSKRYVQDMQKRYMQTNAVFNVAATELIHDIELAGVLHGAELTGYLKDACWPDVRRGLENEGLSWRGDLNMVRIDQEISVLFSEAGEADPLDETTELILASILHIVAFGSLDYSFARSLIDRRPTGALSADANCGLSSSRAFLIKFTDKNRSMILGAWVISQDRLFSIGRYTDCDVVEVDQGLSRIHCCIYWKSGIWWFEDMGSRNGSQVLRNSEDVVFDSSTDGSRVPFELHHGDQVVLSGLSTYWFGAVADDSAYAAMSL